MQANNAVRKRVGTCSEPEPFSQSKGSRWGERASSPGGGAAVCKSSKRADDFHDSLQRQRDSAYQQGQVEALLVGPGEGQRVNAAPQPAGAIVQRRWAGVDRSQTSPKQEKHAPGAAQICESAQTLRKKQAPSRIGRQFFRQFFRSQNRSNPDSLSSLPKGSRRSAMKHHTAAIIKAFRTSTCTEGPAMSVGSTRPPIITHKTDPR